MIELIICVLYVIGVFVSYHYWEIEYEKEVEINGYAEPQMLTIISILSWFGILLYFLYLYKLNLNK